MIQVGKDSWMIEPGDALPDSGDASLVYVDLETTAFDPKVEAFRPYAGHRACGIAITWDNRRDAYYVPVRHRQQSANIDASVWKPWLQRMLEKPWANHNVKFDAHFLAVDDITFKAGLVDVLTLTKMIDSDRYSHGLKEVCRDWSIDPMEEAVKITSYLKASKSKDYASIPPDMLGEYACKDVLATRKLYNEVIRRKPDDIGLAWELEQLLTPVLFDMEHRGFMVDERMLKIEKLKCLRSLVPIADELHQITSHEFANSADHIHDLLVTQRGLPVLAWTKTGGPSFDADALEMYSGHPKVMADPVTARIIELIIKYRTDSTYMSLFVDSLTEKHVDGIVHPSYNQLIRTGRMAGNDPNTQQFNKRAKALVLPRPGFCFLSADASQIEFRLIAHYCKDEQTIAAYADNPDTDYHQWVADQVGMERSPAKTLNFAMAYGAGKKKVEMQLATNRDIMASVRDEVDKQYPDISVERKAELYEVACRARASAIYESYHEQFPGMKATKNRASALANQRGWIRNAYGYRRHLPVKACHNAFNSLVQGCAMHVIKERMVALAPRYGGLLKRWGAYLLINVHDELLIEAPIEVGQDERFKKELVEVLEDVKMPFRVPFKWKIGISTKTWKEAAG